MDDFSDDGFDELNLDELENNAIQFTQAKRIEPTQDQQAEYAFDDDDDDLDAEVVVIDDAPRNQPVVPVNKSFVGSTAARVVPQQTIQQDAWGGPVPVPASHLRNQSYSRPNQSAANLGSRSSQAPAYSQLRVPNALPRPAPTIPSRYQASQAPHQTGPTPQELALQAQIRDLQLKLQSKDGEIGIVRTRLERSRQDHDRELQTLKKQTAEQIAKQERAVEAAKAAEKNATTELEFTKRDLREEVVRAKQKDKNGGTPKKNNTAKSWGIADGFNDVEMAGSPSKGTRGRNPGAVASVVADPPARLTRTPTKPKRKRPPPADSPVMALETTEDVVMGDHGDDALAGSVANISEPAPTPTNSHSFDLLKVVLNHCSAYARPLTLDVLAGYSLPSNPSESLASIILQRITAMGDPNDPLRLPIELCQLLIDLWSRCFHENICDPIVELVSLLSFTVQLSPAGIAPHIAESLITITVECTSEVAIPRLHHNGPGDPTEESFLKYRATIPTTEILSLLYTTALGCETSASVGEDAVSEPIVDFWAYMLVEYVLTLLSPKQAMNDALIMMRLVSTSAFEGTIGPIFHRQRTPEEIASAIIDRVSFFLMNIQAAGLDDHKLWTIRHTALQTLASIATSPFGMRELAKHKLAIPRLVIFLSWSIDELYDGEKTYNAYRLPPPSPPLTEDDDVFATLIRAPGRYDDVQTLIAQTMLLLHTIVTDKRNKDFLDVPAKVAGFTGGSQKYLLSLARLNFAEEGVSEETADLARELLEMIVTEEQGAELGEFFGG